jgi:hypothetical protein
MIKGMLAISNTRPDTEEYECYVCVDDNELNDLRIDLCSCRGRAIHLSCQKLMLEKMASCDASCKVCGDPYKNVEITKTTRVNWCRLCVLCVQLSFMTFFSVCVVYSAYKFLGMDEEITVCFCQSTNSIIHLYEDTMDDKPMTSDNNASYVQICYDWDKNSTFKCQTHKPDMYVSMLLMGVIISILYSYIQHFTIRYVRMHNLKVVHRTVHVSDVSSDTLSLGTVSVDGACG